MRNPFVLVFFWMGMWELIYTDNLPINYVYLIVGYFGTIICDYNEEAYLSNVFMVFFWCAASALFRPHPVIAILGALVAEGLLHFTYTSIRYPKMRSVMRSSL